MLLEIDVGEGQYNDNVNKFKVAIKMLYKGEDSSHYSQKAPHQKYLLTPPNVLALLSPKIRQVSAIA